MSMYKLIRAILKQLKTKQFGTRIDDDEKKTEFEKEILELLKKFNLYDDKKSIQKVEIVASIDNYPKIKIEYMLIEKP